MSRPLRPLPNARKPILLDACPARPGAVAARYPCLPWAEKLCNVAGIAPQGDADFGWYWPLRARFDCVDLLTRHHRGPDPYPIGAARRAVSSLDLRGRVVVCLGRRVAQALDAGPFGDWTTRDTTDLVVIPHPTSALFQHAATRAAISQALAEACIRAGRKVPVDA